MTSDKSETAHPIKIIPVYLPQFHQIPENDAWWGTGFTEWTNVRKALPLFDGHYQPRTPLNNFYYDLTDIETLRWQCKIAKDHGVYGFCFYHYWFNRKLLLEKPMELLLRNPDIDIKYCISWANHNWETTWAATPGNEKTLIAHNFDIEEDWVHHFEYLLPFFKDPRYILEDNRPFMVIYAPHLIGKLERMLSLWNTMAINHGFNGMKFAFQAAMSHHSKGWNRSIFDYAIEFQPGFVNIKKQKFLDKLLSTGLLNHVHKIKRILGIKSRIYSTVNKLGFFDYDETWERVLALKPSAANAIPSGFVDWDNTPRRGRRGTVCIGANPEKFKNYLERLLIKTHDEYRQDKLFLFAWNEWAEGGYLEPDEKYEFGYLKAISDALDGLRHTLDARR